ncbi:MAG: hypothetical protein ABIJ59_17850 [Pseudomonadota bacterium]
MKIIIALGIGIVAGLIDVIPMLKQKINKNSCFSAFAQWVALGLIIPFVNWNIHPCIKGLIIAELFAIPIMIITYPRDPKAVLPITIFSAVLGAAVGFAGVQFIG